MLIVIELFYIAVIDFDAKTFDRYNRVLVITELIVSRTQCVAPSGLQIPLYSV